MACKLGLVRGFFSVIADIANLFHLSQIPYNLTKVQVLTFLGSHAKLITPEFGPSIHIIMDRMTGKTQDCYVEFFSNADVRAWFSSIHGRNPAANRVEDRALDARLSSQDELLKQMFPRAKNVEFLESQPTILPPDGPYNSGFKSFVSLEELAFLVRHAEQPHRVSSVKHRLPRRKVVLTYTLM